jgi:Fe-S-cluster containining protein
LWADCGDLQGGNLPFEYDLSAMEELAQWVWEAARRDDVAEHVGRLYDQLQAEIDKRRPLCIVSGRCCKFDEFGHRLYVTTMELAAFVRGLKSQSTTSLPIIQPPGGCPFQVAKLCTVHTIRPFGCRNFFCDATSTQWQQEQYERFHADLKRLHGALDVPYVYVEWRLALQKLGITGPEQTPPE